MGSSILCELLMRLPLPKLFCHFSFTLSLLSIAPHVRGSIEEESLLHNGFLLRCQAKKKWESWAISPWLLTLPKILLGLGGQVPSATRLPLNLSTPGGHTSQGQGWLWRNIPYHLWPMKWLFHIKGTVFLSSSNFRSPSLTAHLPLPSPPPSSWVAFHLCSPLNKCLSSAPLGEGSPLLQQCLSPSKAWGQGVEGNMESPHGELVWRLLFFPLAYKVEQILNLQSENWRGVGRELGIRSKEKERA